MSAIKIAVANQKGGVGKTTTTMNLGAALALHNDKRVLLVDLDPQANLSDYLGFDGSDGKPTMTQLIINTCQKGVISPEEVKLSIRHNEVNNVDYIPSDINLASADLYMLRALSKETILKRILGDSVTDDYDYVLLDCLPSLGNLLLNALTAADKMIVPVQTQKFSIDGLTALISLHSQITVTLNSSLAEPLILPTMVDNTKVSRSALETLSEKYGDSLLETRIHKSVEAAKSSETGVSLCRNKTKLGEEYKALAIELIEKIGGER